MLQLHVSATHKATVFTPYTRSRPLPTYKIIALWCFWNTLNFCINCIMYFYIPTDSVEQSPSWEATSSSSRQENPLHFWNPEFIAMFTKTPQLLPTRSQINPFHDLKIHNDFPSARWSSWWAFSFSFPTRNPLPHSCYMPRLYNPSFCARFNHIWWAQIMKLLILQSSPVSCHTPPHRPKYLPQRPTLEHPQTMFFF